MTDSFPLKWPVGRSRTPSYSRKNAPFETTPAKSRDALLHELKLMGATNVVISSNVATYRRGGQDFMYADQFKAAEDPGVTVYYTWKGEQYANSCDLWKTVKDNLQALNKTINALRGIERWGTGETMKAAFAGFKALPETPSCWDILGIAPTKDAEVIKAAYRAKAKVNHPDTGGSTEKMQLLTGAYETALKSK